MSITTEKSTMQRVLEVIKDDPGVACAHISERLGVEGKHVSHALAGLRRRNEIMNLGKASKGASWYPKS